MAVKGTDMPSGDELLLGILAILVAEREERSLDAKDRSKTEIVLNKAGLTAPFIAALMGKNVEAVRKVIQRAK